MWSMFLNIANKYVKQIGLSEIIQLDFIGLLDNAEGMAFNCITADNSTLSLSICNKKYATKTCGTEIEYDNVNYIVGEAIPF